MDDDIDCYFNSDDRNHSNIQDDFMQVQQSIPQTYTKFVEMLAISYVKLAYVFIEEIEKPIAIMKKMIRKPLISKKKPKKISAKSKKSRKHTASSEFSYLLDSDINK